MLKPQYASNWTLNSILKVYEIVLRIANLLRTDCFVQTGVATTVLTSKNGAVWLKVVAF